MTKWKYFLKKHDIIQAIRDYKDVCCATEDSCMGDICVCIEFCDCEMEIKNLDQYHVRSWEWVSLYVWKHDILDNMPIPWISGESPPYYLIWTDN